MNKFILIDEEYEERRSSEDRRVSFEATQFPIYTKHGTWVRRECRKTPERRVDNINVSETKLNVSEFRELFKDFSK